MARRWHQGVAALACAIALAAFGLAVPGQSDARDAVTVAAASSLEVTAPAESPALLSDGRSAPQLAGEGHLRVKIEGPVVKAAASLPTSRVLGDAASTMRARLTPWSLAHVPARTAIATAAPASPAPVAQLRAPEPANGSEPAVDCDAHKCVALTFDDGPGPATEPLLDVLAAADARATFFVLGSRVEANADIIARMHADGHEVANHTLTHPRLTSESSKDIAREFDATSDRIEDITGERPALIRPPYGATDDDVAAVAKNQGLVQVLWDVDPLDWKDRDADTIAKRVVKKVQAGSIVLSHDLYDTTGDAYVDIVEALIDEGYTLVTVSELLGDVTPGETYSHGR